MSVESCVRHSRFPSVILDASVLSDTQCRSILVTVALAGWLNQQQDIDYLREENKVLREQLGNRRLRLNDERRRLAARAKKLGHKVLAEVASIVTPDTF